MANWLLRSLPFIGAFLFMVWCGYLADRYPKQFEDFKNGVEKIISKIKNDFEKMFFEG